MVTLSSGNFQLTLSGSSGHRLDRAQPGTRPEPQLRWPDPVQPPRMLLGRDFERQRMWATLATGSPLSVHAECGYGVTSLLQSFAAEATALAADPAAPGATMPATYLRVADQPLPDLRRQLVRACYRWEMGTRPTDQECRRLLRRVRVILVLDDVDGRADLCRDVLEGMPRCRVVFGGRRPAPISGAVTLALAGVSEDEGRQVLATALPRTATEVEREAGRRLWAATSGRPLFLHQAAALAADGRFTLEQLAAAAERDPHQLGRLSRQRLSPGQRRVVGVLALAGGAALPGDLIAAMSAASELGAELKQLPGLGWAEPDQDRYHLPVCRVDGQDGWFLDALDVGSAARELVVWLAGRDPTSVPLSVAEALLTVVRIGAERGEWETVTALVRVAEPVLILAERWEDCAAALQFGVDAAQHLGRLLDAAFFTHQQGSLAALRGDPQRGEHLLRQALDGRLGAGDGPGAAVTQHNLTVLAPPILTGTGPKPPDVPRWWTRVPAVTAATILAVLGIALLGRAVTPPPPPPPTPTTSATTSTPSTSVTPPGPQGPVADIPDTLPFPATLPGLTVDQDLTIANRGDLPLTVSRVRLAGSQADAYVVARECVSKRIDPGEVCRLTVTFRPTESVDTNAVLEVTHDAPGSPSTVTLTGTGLPLPNLRLVPRSADLSSDALTFQVTNDGKGASPASTTRVVITVLPDVPVGTTGADATGTDATGPTAADGEATTNDLRTRPLAVGEQTTLETPVPPGCSKARCTYTITLDADEEVPETDEKDNVVTLTV